MILFYFCRFDTDKSGEIDHHEMARIIYAVLDGNVEGDAEKEALRHAKRLIKMIDLDGDGTLTETEFISVNFTIHFKQI